MRDRLSRLLGRRFLISTRLYLAIGGGVVLTVTASLIGLFSFNRVADSQILVNETSVPQMEAAFSVAEYSSYLVTAAPNLATADTLKELDLAASGIEAGRKVFEEKLHALEVADADDVRFQHIREDSNALLSNMEEIKNARHEFFHLAARNENLQEELAEVRFKLDRVLVPAIDDQLFYTMTGYSDLDSDPVARSVHFTEEELWRYRHLSELLADANIATQLLATGFTLSESASVEPLRERFEAAVNRTGRSLSALEGFKDHEELTQIFNQLSELGIGPGRGFDLLVRELQLEERQHTLLDLNREVANKLVAEVNSLVDDANTNVQTATQASAEAILTGRVLLLGISAFSVGGALVIAWLYIGRMLLPRLQRLSDRMLQMAGGDIEAEVVVDGRDEVADMAAALEIFRSQAHEVLRLGSVEELAQELQGKNEQLESVLEELQEKNDRLESVLAELQKAQDQIVMREKLAALGELTAGVAHEIRNPLNFVKNFSEVSQELIVELREVIDEEESDDQEELIAEISQDISDNLERILSHGNRANRIVHDMLMMGRDSTESQVTNINSLVEEHARLAYHSARAVDPNFLLEMKHEMDPNTGELEVVPQELGRVFLNMVSNACHATDQKRKAAIEAGAADYMPTVWLKSRRDEDKVEVRIRDNGTGMPPDVIEKIFNPFFTTKPTDQGTGLGLSISNDIVLKHGGAIRVESEPGEFTEFIVDLPLEATVAVQQGSSF